MEKACMAARAEAVWMAASNGFSTMLIFEKSELWLCTQWIVLGALKPGKSWCHQAHKSMLCKLANQDPMLPSCPALCSKSLALSCQLCAESGDTYTARFSTNNYAFQNIRVPYNAFRRNEGASEDAPYQLRPQDIRKMGIMAEYRSRAPRMTEMRDLESMTDRSDRQFKLEINRIHVSHSSTTSSFQDGVAL